MYVQVKVGGCQVLSKAKAAYLMPAWAWLISTKSREAHRLRELFLYGGLCGWLGLNIPTLSLDTFHEKER